MRTRVAAALMTAPNQALVLQDLFLDSPLRTEVLVRTDYVALCRSDALYVTGSLQIPAPAVLGHEVSGVVERVGSAVRRLSPGDRVVATVSPACGQCAFCLRGRPTQCANLDLSRDRRRPKLVSNLGEPVGTLAGIGAFASAFLVDESALATVPDDVPMDVACLLGCCISAGAGSVLHGTTISPADTVVVIGCGGVGAAAIQAARLKGARRIVAVDLQAEKLDLARRFGATDVVRASTDPFATERALRLLEPSGYSHAIEAVGRPQTAELAFRVLGPCGTATILGLMPDGEQLVIPAAALVYGDRRLQGAYLGANRFLSDVDLYCSQYRLGRLDLSAMVTTVLPFSRINEAFEAMEEPRSVRVLVDVSGAGR